MKDEDARFVEKAKTFLKDGDTHLDGSTMSRLARIRTEALERHDRRRRGLSRWMGFSVAGAAAGVLGALILFFHSDPSSLMPMEKIPLADIEILASESLELYENLDFYIWLALDETLEG